MDTRKPIGYVVATVKFPVYEGDDIGEGRTFDWFEYREPSITANGDIGTCVRKCKVNSAKVDLLGNP